MVSHEHQCIFVHIPKTAGNSINRMFGVGWEDHKDLRRYRDEMPRELFDSYFKFAVVRNPWDRLLSDYNYQRKKSREKESKLFVFTEEGSKRNFAQWVQLALSDSAHYEARRWGGEVSQTIHRWSPQIDWITVDGAPRVDFVARIEHLQEDFSEVCRRVGLPAQRVPHRNRRLHWHYSHYYDRATRELVSRYYAKDIEYFGYQFEKRTFGFNFGRKKRRIPLASHHRNQEVFARAGENFGGTQASAAPWWATRINGWHRSSPLALVFAIVLALVFTVSIAARTALVQQTVQHSVGHALAQSTRVSETFNTDPLRALHHVLDTPAPIRFSVLGGLPVSLPLLPAIEWRLVIMRPSAEIDRRSRHAEQATQVQLLGGSSGAGDEISFSPPISVGLLKAPS